MRRDWLEAGFLPGRAGSGPDRRAVEGLAGGAAEYEVGVIASRTGLARGELAANHEGHGDAAAAGTGLDVDRARDRIPGALHANDGRIEVDVGPLQSAQLAAPQPAEQRDDPEAALGVRQRGEILVRPLRRLDPVAAAADGREVEVVCRATAICFAMPNR
jgi:hypothetical protein